jgi:geranylgeranyl reductase family protein
MMEPDFDILVVGAGPAGSTAAREAALAGARVLMVERRETVGVPVQCAEYIPAMLLGRIDLGKRFVVQAVAGMKTYRDGGPEKYTRAPGYIIRRDRFDQTLARAAEAAGVHLMTATRAVERWSSGAVVLKKKSGCYLRIHPRIIIGADGPRSTVARWVGAGNDRLLPGVQMTYALTAPLDHTEVYFHPDIRAGYGWVFPKGEVANVGLGFKKNGGATARVRKTLDRFVDRLKGLGRIHGAPRGFAAGWIPVRPLDRAVYGRVALAGDAAGHTHPVTGAGIFAAVAGGQMAGKWAGRAVRERDAGLLENYDGEWRDLMGDALHRARRRRQEMETRWDRFGETVQRCWVAYRAYYA